MVARPTSESVVDGNVTVTAEDGAGKGREVVVLPLPITIGAIVFVQMDPFVALLIDPAIAIVPVDEEVNALVPNNSSSDDTREALVEVMVSNATPDAPLPVLATRND